MNDPHQDLSADNNVMLRRIVQLIEGDGDNAPGILARLSLVEKVLFGKDADGGMVQRVQFMWRTWVWVLCTLSAFGGFMLRELVRIIWHI